MNIGIVGLGLIGASFAKALSRRGIWDVYGTDLDETTVDKALRHGEIQGELTRESLSGCDILIIALYPGETAAYVRDHAAFFKKNGIVIDCCGIKEEIAGVLTRYARDNGFIYIGADPFAGKNESGYDSSSADLFREADIILTPEKDTSTEALNLLKTVLIGAGFSGILEMTPAEHDRIVALTTQLTHIISNALIQSPTAILDNNFFSASFRDLIRRSDLDERMWSEVFIGNKKYLTREMDYFISLLNEYKDMIEAGNSPDLREIMQEGRSRKEKIIQRRTLTVSASKNYEILVEGSLLERAGYEIRRRFRASQVMIVTDDIVDKLYLDKVNNSLKEHGFITHKYVLRHGEASKTFDKLLPLLDEMAGLSMTRSDLIVALGGGVIGDMAGFAAAIYLRGISYVQVPTTLLADVDSSIGGKTAVDLSSGKNLAGAFHQPELVLIDYDTLHTLPDTEFATGMAEVIKHGILADPELFSFAASGDVRGHLSEIITKNLSIKRRFVMADEFDTGARQLLNLGHTLAHAVEKLSGYGINHGNAVSMGLVAIAKAAACHGLAEEDISDEVRETLSRWGLMTECPFTAEEVCGVILSDKKRSGHTINLAIPKRIGECCLYKLDIDKLCEFYRPAI